MSDGKFLPEEVKEKYKAKGYSIAVPKIGEDYLQEAVFSVNKDDIYFRISVLDEKNLTADTNAYFIEDLIK